MNTEQRPTQVRVIIDGVEVAIDDADVRYAGLHDGVHLWNVYGPAGAIAQEPLSVRIGVLPPRTSVALPVQSAPGGGYTFAHPESDSRQ